MTIKVSDYIDVREKLDRLGFRVPGIFALLPSNLEEAVTSDQVRQHATSSTVRTLFRQANVAIVDVFETDSTPPYVHNNDITWVAPAMFVAAGVFSEQPSVVAVALGVLSNYITDFFKGRRGQPVVKVTTIVEQSKSKIYRRIEYEGDAAGLKSLESVVKEVQNGTTHS
jgi:hypothetical protein